MNPKKIVPFVVSKHYLKQTLESVRDEVIKLLIHAQATQKVADIIGTEHDQSKLTSPSTSL
jgi:hypothetical protein